LLPGKQRRIHSQPVYKYGEASFFGYSLVSISRLFPDGSRKKNERGYNFACKALPQSNIMKGSALQAQSFVS
jgi:hypothetical protein